MPGPGANQDEFVTTQEAARLLGVSVRSIQLWVENGVLHAWKTAGGHRRIARASVDDLLAQQREVIQTVTGLKLVKLLLIEDNPAYLELYRIKIESWKLPVTVLTARNGFEGLIAIGKSDPRIIVTRLQFPGMDGWEMIRALDTSAPAAELIVTTDLSDAEIETRGGLPERVVTLRSPVELEQLEALLRAKVQAVQAGGR